MEVYFTKGPRGSLLPLDDEQAELLAKLPQGALVRAQIASPRNAKFHRKCFALLNYAYGVWKELQPPREWRGQPVVTSFERFREDVTILAGHYEPVFNAQGELRLIAKSISFAKMDDVAFEQFYSRLIDTLLTKVLTNTKLTEAKLREYVEQVLRFD